MSKLVDVGTDTFISSEAIRDPNMGKSQMAINDYFKTYLNGMLKVVAQSYTPSGTNSTKCTYPTVSGYSLVTPLRIQTDGWIGTPYIVAEKGYASVWDNGFTSDVTSDKKYTITYLFVKNL